MCDPVFEGCGAGVVVKVAYVRARRMNILLGLASARFHVGLNGVRLEGRGRRGVGHPFVVRQAQAFWQQQQLSATCRRCGAI